MGPARVWSLEGPFVGPRQLCFRSSVKEIGSLAESSSARDLPQCDDDDDFMEPLPRRPVTKKQCINASVADNATGKVQ